MRLFFGIALPDETRELLVAHLSEMLGDRPLPGRAVPPENWHLTLRFLGGTSDAQVEQLRSALQAQQPLGARFEIGFSGYGAFPRPARASVLWLGVEEGKDSLRDLAAELETAAQRVGFPAEKRSFTPHLTLSRTQPPQDLRDLLSRLQPFRHRFTAEDIVLFRSHLGSGPARYEAMERFTLT